MSIKEAHEAANSRTDVLRATSWAGRLSRLRSRLSSFRLTARAWLYRHLPNESQHLFALTLAVGLVCGFAAVAFHLSIRAAEGLLIERALKTPGPNWMLWTLLSPTLGGLFAGAALTWIVPGARGSGIPQVKQAFATAGGRVRFRDATGKFVIAALQIGSGASLGREGPTVQICAGAASMLARATSLPPRSMRRLTPVGVAAGIAAAFNAPIAAVTFTIEEIVGALDHTMLSGIVVAAALAAVIERSILGVHPVIEVAQSYGLDHASSLVIYALLGVAAAVVSIAFTEGLLELRRRFRDFRAVPSWAHPAVGGLVTGALAVASLRWLRTAGVTGGGYETLGRALAGELGFEVLLALCVLKLVATVFSYSSGGAGGIFAPALFVGAMLGGAFGHLDVALLQHEHQQVGAFALVGMGAVFAGVIRAPITSVLIIFEMTGGYGLVLPLMLANMTSYVLARHWRPLPIYEALLEQDGISLPRTSRPAHPLEQVRVADAMTVAVESVAPNQSIGEAARSLSGASFTIAPVMDDDGTVLGSLSVSQVRQPHEDPDASVTLLMRPAQLIRADAPLLRAIVRMNDLGTRQLLVVDERTGKHLVGILAMSDLVRAHSRAVRGTDTSDNGDRRRAPEPAELLTSAAIVDGSAKLSELRAQLVSSTGCLLVRTDYDCKVLLPEYLAEFARDDDLVTMLVAVDLARAAPSVAEATDLQQLARAMSEAHADAVIVLGAESHQAIGVITRRTLEAALLNWFAVPDAAQARADLQSE
jgi:CIC family chloride channel protein